LAHNKTNKTKTKTKQFLSVCSFFFNDLVRGVRIFRKRKYGRRIPPSWVENPEPVQEAPCKLDAIASFFSNLPKFTGIYRREDEQKNIWVFAKI